MTIQELYALKGEYITQIELYKAKLQRVNSELEGILTKQLMDTPKRDNGKESEPKKERDK